MSILDLLFVWGVGAMILMLLLVVLTVVWTVTTKMMHEHALRDGILTVLWYINIAIIIPLVVGYATLCLLAILTYI